MRFLDGGEPHGIPLCWEDVLNMAVRKRYPARHWLVGGTSVVKMSENLGKC